VNHAIVLVAFQTASLVMILFIVALLVVLQRILVEFELVIIQKVVMAEVELVLIPHAFRVALLVLEVNSESSFISIQNEIDFSLRNLGYSFWFLNLILVLSQI